MNICEVVMGTILVSNSQWGPTFVEVKELVPNKFGAYLNCEIISCDYDETRVGQIETVHTIGKASMRGIGFKMLNSDDVRALLRRGISPKQGE